VTRRAGAKPTTIPLNLLRSYGVRWDAQTFVRDLLQNFFDASHDFEGVNIDIHRSRGAVRIEGPVPFALDYVKYIGGTTKAKGGFAGQFGEGFKICSLVALRDFGVRILAGAGQWRIEPAFRKVRVGEELVYRHTRGPELPGSFVELQNCSPELMDLIAEGRRFFRWSGNPSFGERLFSEGAVHVYRSTRRHGELYYGKQLRAELWDLPFALCLDSTLKRIRADRDRRELATNQVRIVMADIGTHLPLAIGMTIVNELEAHWRNGRSPLMWLIGGLAERHQPSRAEAWPAGAPEAWVAEEYAPRLQRANEFARRVGYQVADRTLAGLGMRRAGEVWEQSIQLVPDSDLTSVERARRLLLAMAAESIHRGTHPPLRFARMQTTEGLHRKDEVILERALLQGELGPALTTYLHELCHEHGRDGDARFSDALTEVLQRTVESHALIERLTEFWSGVARLEPEDIEEALEIEDRYEQLVAISELVSMNRRMLAR